MKPLSLNSTVFLIEGFGFGFIIILLWINELFDLPHVIFNTPATPINYSESIIESIAVIILGTIISIIISKITKKLELANNEKTKLFSIISHDLKNIFSIIISNSNFLYTSFDDLGPNDKYELSAAIYHSSRRCFHLVNNLLNWSKTQLKRTTVQVEPTAILPAIEESLQLYEEKVKHKSLTCLVTVKQDHITFFDRTMLKSILQNLISNAVKFSNPNGIIEITATQDNHYITLKIIDNGIGMDTKFLSHLIKSDNFESTRGTCGEKGSGIGLYLIKEYIRVNHAYLKIRSQKGQGSTFELQLPKSKLIN